MSSHWYMYDADNDIVEITGYVDLNKLPSATTNAEQGSVATSQITLDDPNGELEVTGHKAIWWDEDEADFSRIFTGYIAQRDYQRDDYRTSVARTIKVTVTDINTLLARKVEAGHDTDRPSESDNARMAWLLGTGEAGDLGDVTTYVTSASPVTMDAVPDTGYNGQMLQSVVDDCAQSSGKNYYMLDAGDAAGVHPAVWYAHDDVAAFASDLRISNYLEDVDQATIFYALLDSKLNKDPSRVFSGLFGNYDGGYTYQFDSGTLSAFANRDTIANWPNVKSLSKAQARALRQLEDLDEEEDVISTGYFCAAQYINDLRPGQRMFARFSHFALEGYGDWREFRVLNRTVTEVAPGPDDDIRYRVNVDLSPLPPPVECADVVAEVTGENTGYLDNAAAQPVTWSSIPAPSTFPCVAVAFGEYTRDDTAIGNGGMYVDSPWTELDHWCPSSGYRHDNNLSAYLALTSGAPDDFTCGWIGNGARAWGAAVVYVPTAATAPVQHAANVSGSGSSVTLPSAPTPGNLLVAHGVAYRGFSPNDNPGPGWTQIEHFVSPTIGITQRHFIAWARCATESDTNVIVVKDSSYPHWLYVSEWELT